MSSAKEKELLLLKKYVRVEFGSHVFYLPCIPANVSFSCNTLSIDMADMQEYVLVDGIRCYYCMIYNAESEMVQTQLKDFTIDGLICPEFHAFSFRLTDKEFSLSKRDMRMVVPKRDYMELVSAFINDHKDLNESVVKFLEEHPETFDKAPIYEWMDLSNQISMYKDYNSIDIDNDFLQSIAEKLL